MASITDVAREAGCSVTLVSRVINNQSGVSDKTRNKIQKVIDELGYTPSGLARSLVLKKTNTIGIVLDTLCDAYFFDLIKAIEENVEESGYDVLFCNGSYNPEKKNRYINYFMQGRVDGIIIYGSNLDDVKLLKRLVNANFPFAIIENDVGFMNANNILVNNEYGSQLAVDHLFECGCRDIVHVAGDPEVQAARRRLDGYTNAMIAHGATREKCRVLQSGWSEEEGYQSVRDFLKDNKLPDAFYFSSDQTAYGGMKALLEAGMKIPEGMMIVGFDDDKPRNNDILYTPLTTIHQPLDEMGKTAASILVSDIVQKKEAKDKMMFYPSLVVRSTTKKE